MIVQSIEIQKSDSEVNPSILIDWPENFAADLRVFLDDKGLNGQFWRHAALLDGEHLSLYITEEESFEKVRGIVEEWLKSKEIHFYLDDECEDFCRYLLR